MDIKSALVGLFMGMSKADKEILKSYLEDVPEASMNIGVHQEVLSRHSLLRGVQLGKINEQDLRHHYAILGRADEIWRDKYKEEFNSKLETLGDNVDKYPIDFIITNNKILLNEMISKEAYSPILVNRYVATRIKIEDICDQVYVKNIGNGERLIEFYCDMYEHKHLYKILKENDLTLENSTDIHSIILDEKQSYKIICHGYSVKRFDKMIENNGCFVLKFICELVGKEE